MLPFVAAGVAAGGVSYFIGLPLAYAAFLAIAIVAVAVGVTSALTVKVPQIEPKARKLKIEKNRHGSAAASSSLSSDTAADTSEKPDKAEDNKSEPKALSKRDKERAKKAAKKEADEKQKQAEADRAAAEEKQKQEAARVAKEAAAAAAKAAEAAEKERLAALEAEEDEEDEAPAKKNKKKKKKKTEEKKGNDSAPTPTAKSSESKNAAPTPTAKSSGPTPTAKKGEPADSKKSKDSSAKAEAAAAASNKGDASKKVEVAPKNTESHAPAAAVELDEKVDAKESATQDSSMAWEVKTSKKNKRAPEPAAAAVPPTPTTTSSSSDQKVEITIDPRNLGVIIGKGGSTMKQITEATQTKIDFSKEEEGRVTVSGPSRENIDKAIAAMNQLAAKGYSDLTHGVRDEASIEVPSNKRFNIIGTKGETVRLIQDRLKVKVNMPDRNTNDSKVTVLGENADVQEALRCISDLMTKGYSEITHPGWVSEVVEVPSGQLGNIIGAQGATVREIQDSTGAKINIEGSTVTVLGQQTQVAEAKNKITQLLTPAEPLPADPEWSQGASARYVDLW